MATTDSEQSILQGMLAASADACWCMEFGVPVDLTAPDREVIRQIFENDPYWRFCNEAMARMYRLPSGLDFNQRPVHEIFPRNAQKEDFIRNLLACGFRVDAAPALDSRYDGVQIYVENDVRAHIQDGRLIRMFGVVRDVSKHKRRETALRDRLEQALDLLAAMPDPLLALDAGDIIEAANPAAAEYFAIDNDALLGQHLFSIVFGAARAIAPPAVRADLQQALDSVRRWQRPALFELAPGTASSGARWHIGPRAVTPQDHDQRKGLVITVRLTGRA